MEPFATPDDYEARFGDADDDARLAAFLADATNVIAAELDRKGRTWQYSPPSDEFAPRLAQACVSIAHRMEGDKTPAPFGVTQYSQGAGGYTEQYTFGNPYGDAYLTKEERVLLGLTGPARAGFAEACP